jgi:hypothetical protein
MQGCTVGYQPSHIERSDSRRQDFASVRGAWDFVFGPQIGDLQGPEARSIVHWYRIVCDFDDVDAESMESLFPGGWVTLV